jgi:hypothetical protein
MGRGPLCCADSVDLKGCLSNFEARRAVSDVQSLLDGEPITVPHSEMAATRAKRRAPEPIRLRLGDAAVADLVAEFVAGTTRQNLADQYGVSVSSVKRLIRGSGARRGDTPR